jgi:dipeptidyl aminopeptidase/acylaminoacyl peptidase
MAATGAVTAMGSSAHAAPPPSIRETIEIVDLSSPAVSPDGTLVVFREQRASVENNRHELAWFVVPVDGHSPARRIAGAGEGRWLNGTLLSEPPVWTPGSAWIIYRAVIDGEAQLWRAAADGSKVERLTSEPGNVKDFALAADGRTLTYSAGPPREEIARAEELERDTGVLIDATVDPSRPLFRGGRIDGRRATERLQGFWFGHSGLLGDRSSKIRLVDLLTSQVRDADASEAKQLVPPAKPFDAVEGRLVVARADALDARGTAFVLSSGNTGELLVTKSGALKDAKTCTAGGCRGKRITSVVWQQGANAVLFTTADGGGNDGLHLWNVSSGTVSVLASGRGALNGGRDRTQGCSAGRASLVCVAASANMPPRLIAINLRSRRTTNLHAPNEALAPIGAPRFEAMTWSDRAGRRFTGQLMLPDHLGRPAPLFITYYSCAGYLRGGLGDEFPLRELARSGIAALCINRHPAPDGISDQVEEYRVAHSGVEAAIDLLAREKKIDPDRVGMGGVSFGGESAIWIAIHSRLLAALSIANVLLTPTYYWFNALAGREVPDVLRKGWGIGDPDREPAGWRELSAAMNADRIKAPLLMQLAEQEYRPNVEIAARLQRAGGAVELWAFPDEVHIKWEPRHQLAANERNLEWFRFWLQGWVDPSPSKRERYRRWETLREKVVAQAIVAPPSQPRSQDSVSMIGSNR